MTTPLKAVALACRGEIAVRLARACREAGCRSVALYEPADAGAMHVRVADASHEVGSYLDPDALAAAAREAGCDALHPGYGFLSESAELAESCARVGVRFVGPPPSALMWLARKDAARELAERAGVPVVQGGRSPDGLPYPLLVKAAAGGGGRGMRVVRDPGDLDEAIAAAGREAQAAFGDDTLLYERYVEEARHVEIQVIADAEGGAVHLGERDCSVQRRHQKVLEEAPAPGVGKELRAELGAAALRLAAEVGYVGAGTAEFLLEPDGSYAFLEMNARIQVEHPVTEAVTSIDIARRQLEIAAGAPLGIGQGDLVLRGHAVEARVYAEDPDAGFLPRAGRVLQLRWPAGPGIRVDAGIEAGDEVGTRYDPLLAKIIAHGENREWAFARLRTALEETVVLGVVTNIPFLRWLVAHPRLLAGPVTTDFLEREWTPVAPGPPAAEVLEAAAAFAARERGASPWTGRWRAAEPRAAPTLAVARGDDGGIRRVARRALAAGRAEAPRRGGRARSRGSARGETGAARIVSPMPGAVLRVAVREGDRVAAHDLLVVLEAMKMEHPLTAPYDGVVRRITCREGEQVRAGGLLVEISGDEK